jgi:hypothetical protein
MDEFTLPTSDQPLPEKLRYVSERLLEEILIELKLERALTLVNLDGTWSVGTSHELCIDDFWNQAPISLGILEAAVDKQGVVVLMDAGQSDEFGGRTSVILSGLRSVACAPFVDDSGDALALLYVDNRVHIGAFTEEDGEKLQKFANEFGRRLIEAL